MRVSRCFSFIDLCGFTSYTERHGDNEAVAVLALLRATLRAEAERTGVRVTKWLGDGAMLSGVDRIAVLDCTATVAEVMAERSPLALRAGIAEGPVIMFEGDDYIGAAVNAAARLRSAARPGQILIAASVADEPLPDWLAIEPLEPVSVAGFSRPVDVAEMRIRRRAA